MIDFSAPLQGIQRAEASLNRTAGRVASLGSPQGDAMDLSGEAVALLTAKTSMQANLNVLRTEANLSRSIVNLLA